MNKYNLNNDFNLLFLASDEHFLVYAESRFGEARPVQVKKEEVGHYAVHGKQFTRFDLSDRDRAAKAGEALYHFIIREEIRELYQKTRTLSLAQERTLRIVLKFPFSPELQAVPWELLHDGNTFLSITAQPLTAVIRYTLGLEPPPDKVPEGKLRILVTTACPDALPALQVDQELSVIEQALEPQKEQVELIVMRAITLEKLRLLWQREEQQNRPIHIWHHSGHGQIQTTGEGPVFKLLMEGDSGPESVSPEELTSLIAMNVELRATIMNVCFSGEGVGLATLLANIHIPLSIGFRGAVDDNAALDFARAFYQGIHHGPVEKAFTMARQALWNNGNLAPMAWAGPLIHCRYQAPALVPVYEPETTPSNSDHVGTAAPIQQAWINERHYRGIGKIGYVRIDPGTGVMGSLADVLYGAAQNETPQTSITFSRPLFMAETPLTHGELKRLIWLAEKRCQHLPPELKRVADKQIHLQEDLPITAISHVLAMKVIALLNRLETRFRYRLPTEAEWEYAARAGDDAGYAWQQLQSLQETEVWCQQNGGKRPRPVRMAESNAFGLFDMLGNVQEWCATPLANYPGGEALDWRPETKSKRRTLRGGSFAEPLEKCYYASRFSAEREHEGQDYGIRLVFDPPNQ